MLLLEYAIIWIDSTTLELGSVRIGDWDQKGVEEMGELIVRVSFISFCSPSVGRLSGCWTICAGISILWSRRAIDQCRSSGRCYTHSTSLSPPSWPYH